MFFCLNQTHTHTTTTSALKVYKKSRMVLVVLARKYVCVRVVVVRCGMS